MPVSPAQDESQPVTWRYSDGTALHGNQGSANITHTTTTMQQQDHASPASAHSVNLDAMHRTQTPMQVQPQRSLLSGQSYQSYTTQANDNVQYANENVQYANDNVQYANDNVQYANDNVQYVNTATPAPLNTYSSYSTVHNAHVHGAEEVAYQQTNANIVNTEQVAYHNTSAPRSAINRSISSPAVNFRGNYASSERNTQRVVIEAPPQTEEKISESVTLRPEHMVSVNRTPLRQELETGLQEIVMNASETVLPGHTVVHPQEVIVDEEEVLIQPETIVAPKEVIIQPQTVVEPQQIRICPQEVVIKPRTYIQPSEMIVTPQTVVQPEGITIRPRNIVVADEEIFIAPQRVTVTDVGTDVYQSISVAPDNANSSLTVSRGVMLGADSHVTSQSQAASFNSRSGTTFNSRSGTAFNSRSGTPFRTQIEQPQERANFYSPAGPIYSQNNRVMPTAVNFPYTHQSNGSNSLNGSVRIHRSVVSPAMTNTQFNTMHQNSMLRSTVRDASPLTGTYSNGLNMTNDDHFILESHQMQTPRGLSATNNGGTFMKSRSKTPVVVRTQNSPIRPVNAHTSSLNQQHSSFHYNPANVRTEVLHVSTSRNR